MTSELFEAAQRWLHAGFNLIPIRADGTKRPLFEWKRFMTDRTTEAMVEFWLGRNPGAGLGIVCGAVSGDLEMLELEGRAHTAEGLAKIQAEVRKHPSADDAWNTITQGLVVESPSGGVHFFYRIGDNTVPGNTKIAQRPATAEELEANPKAKVKVLAETRGEGGFVVAAPTGGTVHPTGLSWEIVSGGPESVPTISWDERQCLHAAIYAALDEMPEVQEVPPKPEGPRPTAPQGDGTRPGDDFNDRADWSDQDLLGGAGWTISHRQGNTTYWVKPGANPRDGHHATTGRDGSGANDRLYVFSTSTEFPTEEPLSKFAVYAMLNHNGDFKAATRALSADGYGDDPLSPRTVSVLAPDWSQGDFGGQEQPAERTFADANQAPMPPVQPTWLPTKRDYNPTSVGNAERLATYYSQDFRYVPHTSQWMVWQGNKWAVDHGLVWVNQATIKMTYDLEAEARQAQAAAGEDKDARKAADKKYAWFLQSQMDRTMNGTIAQFSRRPEVAAKPEDFDNHPGYLNCPNGIYDLRNHQLLPHDRRFMATQMFGAAYDPDAQAPRFRQLIETLLPDETMRRFVQRAIGYSLLGDPDQRSFFITHGPRRTGKSQFHNLMLALFGDYGDTAMAGAFHKVDKKGDAATPGLHALRNKRFVSTSEESEHAVLDTESLKRLAGNEAITTRALYQDGIRWKPQMVLWIATNPLPQLNSDDDAIWDRVKPVPFTTKFSAKGTDGSIKETPGISDKIFAEEASGIFNWALEGLKEFQQLEGLDDPEQIATGVADYRHETDPVSQYLSEMQELGQLEPQADARAAAKPLYLSYTEWCRESNTYPINARRFHRRVRVVLAIDDYGQSNGQYYLPGWRWTLRHGSTGMM